MVTEQILLGESLHHAIRNGLRFRCIGGIEWRLRRLVAHVDEADQLPSRIERSDEQPVRRGLEKNGRESWLDREPVHEERRSSTAAPIHDRIVEVRGLAGRTTEAIFGQELEAARPVEHVDRALCGADLDDAVIENLFQLRAKLLDLGAHAANCRRLSPEEFHEGKPGEQPERACRGEHHRCLRIMNGPKLGLPVAEMNEADGIGACTSATSSPFGDAAADSSAAESPLNTRDRDDGGTFVFDGLTVDLPRTGVHVETVGNAFDERRLGHDRSLTRALSERLQLLDDLALGRKPSLVLFGEENLIRGGHDENAAAPPNELTLDAQGLPDLGRQTGGTGQVISNAAVVDSNVHKEPRQTVFTRTAVTLSRPPRSFAASISS
jgi:hypothetical protein